MANAIYPITKGSLLQGSVNMNTGTVKAALVGSGYTYAATHDFFDDLGANVIGTPQTLASKTFTNGTFDAADVSWTALASGSTVKAVVIYIDTGTASTSRLIAYLDGMTNLPLATNGGDVSITWDATGIFTI